MVRPTCTLYITIRVTSKSYTQTIQQGIHTSTSAQPLGTRPPVLSHKDVILNRSLSQLSPQENHLEYHIVSTLTQRRTIHPSHGHTQPLGDDSTLQKRTMPQPLGDDSTLTQRRTMPHHVGMPNTGVPLKSTQLSLRGERVLEDVSRSCNHQHYPSHPLEG